jgi:hypothetical protein
MKHTSSAKLVKEALSNCASPPSYIFLPLLCTFFVAVANLSLDEVPSKGAKVRTFRRRKCSEVFCLGLVFVLVSDCGLCFPGPSPANEC